MSSIDSAPFVPDVPEDIFANQDEVFGSEGETSFDALDYDSWDCPEECLQASEPANSQQKDDCPFPEPCAKLKLEPEIQSKNEDRVGANFRQCYVKLERLSVAEYREKSETSQPKTTNNDNGRKNVQPKTKSKAWVGDSWLRRSARRQDRALQNLLPKIETDQDILQETEVIGETGKEEEDSGQDGATDAFNPVENEDGTEKLSLTEKEGDKPVGSHGAVRDEDPVHDLGDNWLRRSARRQDKALQKLLSEGDAIQNNESRVNETAKDTEVFNENGANPKRSEDLTKELTSKLTERNLNQSGDSVQKKDLIEDIDNPKQVHKTDSLLQFISAAKTLPCWSEGAGNYIRTSSTDPRNDFYDQKYLSADDGVDSGVLSKTTFPPMEKHGKDDVTEESASAQNVNTDQIILSTSAPSSESERSKSDELLLGKLILKPLVVLKRIDPNILSAKTLDREKQQSDCERKVLSKNDKSDSANNGTNALDKVSSENDSGENQTGNTENTKDTVRKGNIFDLFSDSVPMEVTDSNVLSSVLDKSLAYGTIAKLESIEKAFTKLKDFSFSTVSKVKMHVSEKQPLRTDSTDKHGGTPETDDRLDSRNVYICNANEWGAPICVQRKRRNSFQVQCDILKKRRLTAARLVHKFGTFSRRMAAYRMERLKGKCADRLKTKVSWQRTSQSKPTQVALRIPQRQDENTSDRCESSPSDKTTKLFEDCTRADQRKFMETVPSDTFASKLTQSKGDNFNNGAIISPLCTATKRSMKCATEDHGNYTDKNATEGMLGKTYCEDSNQFFRAHYLQPQVPPLVDIQSLQNVSDVECVQGTTELFDTDTSTIFESVLEESHKKVLVGNKILNSVDNAPFRDSAKRTLATNCAMSLVDKSVDDTSPGKENLISCTLSNGNVGDGSDLMIKQAITGVLAQEVQPNCTSTFSQVTESRQVVKTEPEDSEYECSGRINNDKVSAENSTPALDTVSSNVDNTPQIRIKSEPQDSGYEPATAPSCALHRCLQEISSNITQEPVESSSPVNSAIFHQIKVEPSDYQTLWRTKVKTEPLNTDPKSSVQGIVMKKEPVDIVPKAPAENITDSKSICVNKIASTFVKTEHDNQHNSDKPLPAPQFVIANTFSQNTGVVAENGDVPNAAHEVCSESEAAGTAEAALLMSMLLCTDDDSIEKLDRNNVEGNNVVSSTNMLDSTEYINIEPIENSDDTEFRSDTEATSPMIHSLVSTTIPQRNSTISVDLLAPNQQLKNEGKLSPTRQNPPIVSTSMAAPEDMRRALKTTGTPGKHTALLFDSTGKLVDSCTLDDYLNNVLAEKTQKSERMSRKNEKSMSDCAEQNSDDESCADTLAPHVSWLGDDIDYDLTSDNEVSTPGEMVMTVGVPGFANVKCKVAVEEVSSEKGNSSTILGTWGDIVRCNNFLHNYAMKEYSYYPHTLQSNTLQSKTLQSNTAGSSLFSCARTSLKGKAQQPEHLIMGQKTNHETMSIPSQSKKDSLSPTKSDTVAQFLNTIGTNEQQQPNPAEVDTNYSVETDLISSASTVLHTNGKVKKRKDHVAPNKKSFKKTMAAYKLYKIQFDLKSGKQYAHHIKKSSSLAGSSCLAGTYEYRGGREDLDKHNKLERERRIRLLDDFANLKSLIPKFATTKKPSRQTILEEAQKLILELEVQSEELKKEWVRERNRNIVLKTKLKELRGDGESTKPLCGGVDVSCTTNELNVMWLQHGSDTEPIDQGRAQDRSSPDVDVCSLEDLSIQHWADNLRSTSVTTQVLEPVNCTTVSPTIDFSPQMPPTSTGPELSLVPGNTDRMGAVRCFTFGQPGSTNKEGANSTVVRDTVIIPLFHIN